MIKYHHSDAVKTRISEIAAKLGIKHDLSRVACVESVGSKSTRTLARCHALPRIMQVALGTKAHYVIEVITENFSRLPKAEQDKTLIHELIDDKDIEVVVVRVRADHIAFAQNGGRFQFQ